MRLNRWRWHVWAVAADGTATKIGTSGMTKRTAASVALQLGHVYAADGTRYEVRED